MKTPRLVMAAVAAGFLSAPLAAWAQMPSAAQVTVPPGAGGQGSSHAKMAALFDNQQEFMMFRVQMHQSTKGMSKDQRKAYRKQQVQQVEAMNDAQKAQWRQGLMSQWNALPDAKKNRMEQKFANQQQAHQQHQQAHAGGPSGTGYMDPDSGPSGSPQ
jgi:hypothetical protein